MNKIAGFIKKKYMHLIYYPMCGLKSFYVEEKSARYITIIILLTNVVAYFTDFSFSEYVVMNGLAAFLVIIELLNSSIENVVDMVTQEYNDYAKKAKDQAAAAEFVVAILWIGVSALLLFDISSI